MRNLAELAAGDKEGTEDNARALVEEGAGVSGPLTPEQDEAIRHVFRVLHGWYGNLFLSRYTVGRELPKGDPNAGEDEGMVNARRMWAFAIRSFSGETIRAALNATRPAHPEFPPTLPQFEALCRARAPRGPVVPMKDGKPLLLTMSDEHRSERARRAREIQAKHERRARAAREGVRRIEPGLQGLKVAIANAIGAAGGDEAAALLRLDRELTTTKASHG